MPEEWVHRLALDILVESIKYPTVIGESYGELVEYYAGVLREHGVHVSIHEVPRDYVREKLPPIYNPDKPRYILLARVGSGDRVLQFNGHYDVVAGGSGWSVTKPFEPRIVDGKVYGRGSTDMKGGVAAFLATLAYLAKSGYSGAVVEAAVVPDEEIGGVTGTGYLVEHLGSRPDAVVIAEPSGLDTIWIGHKGAVWLNVTVYGKQAHGSTPWLGDNAFEKMIYIARDLVEEYKPRLRERRSSYAYDMEESRYPTITMGGKLSGPGSINIVPGAVSFSIDRRTIVEENIEEVERELHGFIKESARRHGARVDISVVSKLPPAFTSPDSPLTRMVEEAAHRVTGARPRKVVCTGGRDLHYYSEHGVAAVSYGPGDTNLAHKADEYISIEDLYRAVDIYVELARIFAAQRRG